jgi:hypothetical protein
MKIRAAVVSQGLLAVAKIENRPEAIVNVTLVSEIPLVSMKK